jgi:hypothetical protein
MNNFIFFLLILSIEHIQSITYINKNYQNTRGKKDIDTRKTELINLGKHNKRKNQIEINQYIKLTIIMIMRFVATKRKQECISFFAFFPILYVRQRINNQNNKKIFSIITFGLICNCS